MSEKPRILILDDEQEVLNSLRRVFRKSYLVDCFDNGEDALAAMEHQFYPVIISDMRMPHMDGAEFLTRSNDISPDSIRILLTGYADLDSTIRAINQGDIFSYASKPWNNDDLSKLVENALAHYGLRKQNIEMQFELAAKNLALENKNSELIQEIEHKNNQLEKANKQLKLANNKQKTLLKDLVNMVRLIIEDRTKDTQGHINRVATHSKLLAKKLSLPLTEVNQIYFAALFNEVGKVSLTDSLLELTESQRNNNENKTYQSHAIEGAAIVSKISNFAQTAVIIKHQYENVDGSGFPDNLAQQDIPIGSRILRIVKDYDDLLLGTKLKDKLLPEDALNYLKKFQQFHYDSAIVSAYAQLLKKMPQSELNVIEYSIPSSSLEPGMVLANDIVNFTGGVLMTENTELTEKDINKIQEYEQKQNCQLTLFVY